MSTLIKIKTKNLTSKGAVTPLFFFFFFFFLLHIIVAIPLNKKFSFFYDTFMHTFKDIHYFVTLSHYFKSLIYVMIGTRDAKCQKILLCFDRDATGGRHPHPYKTYIKLLLLLC